MTPTNKFTSDALNVTTLLKILKSGLANNQMCPKCNINLYSLIQTEY